MRFSKKECSFLYFHNHKSIYSLTFILTYEYQRSYLASYLFIFCLPFQLFHPSEVITGLANVDFLKNVFSVRQSCLIKVKPGKNMIRMFEGNSGHYQTLYLEFKNNFMQIIRNMLKCTYKLIKLLKLRC